MRPFLVYLITDPTRDPVAIVRAALEAAAPGEVGVMARDKRAPPRELAALARALLPICRARGAALLVNDRCDIAHAVGADGAHLPERGLAVADARAVLGPAARIGVSRHGPGSASGADLVTLGPVGAVPGKGPPMGVEGFAEAAASYGPLPVYALGGVDAEVAPDLCAAGASGIAVVRAVCASPDPAASLGRLIERARAALCAPRCGGLG